MVISRRRVLFPLIVIGIAAMLLLLVLQPAGEPDTGIVLATERPTYATGEVVGFFIRNNRADPVELPSTAPWNIQRRVDGEWKRVEVHVSADVIVPVAPGEVVSWSWKAETQTEDPELVPVSPGQYRIVLSVRLGDQLVEVVAGFGLS